MAINIEDINYVKSIKRTTATSIDMFIVALLRVFVAQILGIIWVNKMLQNYINDFEEHFGTAIIKNTQEHINYTIQHPIFLKIIFVYLLIFSVGMFYHSLLNSSSWQGTVGKRIMGIMIVNNDNFQRINFLTAISHYILSILPILFFLYILLFTLMTKSMLFEAITQSKIHLLFGIASLAWIQIHAFTKRKRTAYDFICKTVFIIGRSDAKLPWKKIDVTK